MAKFQKGNKMAKNGGRKKLPPDLLKAKQLTSEEFMRTATELLRLSPQEICNIVNDPATPALKALVGTMIVKAIDEGDERRTDFLLQRIIGKVPDKLETNAPTTIMFIPATKKGGSK